MNKISVCHPTCRPEMARVTREKWLDLSKNPDSVEHLTCIDSYQIEKINKKKISKNIKEFFFPCLNKKSVGVIPKLNFLSSIVTTNCIVTETDDVTPCKDWDYLIYNSTNWNDDVVMRIGDNGYLEDKGRPYLIRQTAISKKRVQKYGYFLHPNFYHVFSDDFYSWLSHKDNVVIENEKIHFYHDNPLYKNSMIKRDKFHNEAMSPESYDKGKMIFLDLTLKSINNSEIKKLIEEYTYSSKKRRTNINFVLTCVGIDVEKLLN